MHRRRCARQGEGADGQVGHIGIGRRDRITEGDRGVRGAYRERHRQGLAIAQRQVQHRRSPTEVDRCAEVDVDRDDLGRAVRAIGRGRGDAADRGRREVHHGVEHSRSQAPVARSIGLNRFDFVNTLIERHVVQSGGGARHGGHAQAFARTHQAIVVDVVEELYRRACFHGRGEGQVARLLGDVVGAAVTGVIGIDQAKTVRGSRHIKVDQQRRQIGAGRTDVTGLVHHSRAEQGVVGRAQICRPKDVHIPVSNVGIAQHLGVVRGAVPQQLRGIPRFCSRVQTDPEDRLFHVGDVVGVGLAAVAGVQHIRHTWGHRGQGIDADVFAGRQVHGCGQGSQVDIVARSIAQGRCIDARACTGHAQGGHRQIAGVLAGGHGVVDRDGACAGAVVVTRRACKGQHLARVERDVQRRRSARKVHRLIHVQSQGDHFTGVVRTVGRGRSDAGQLRTGHVHRHVQRRDRGQTHIARGIGLHGLDDVVALGQAHVVQRRHCAHHGAQTQTLTFVDHTVFIRIIEELDFRVRFHRRREGQAARLVADVVGIAVTLIIGSHQIGGHRCGRRGGVHQHIQTGTGDAGVARQVQQLGGDGGGCVHRQGGAHGHQHKALRQVVLGDLLFANHRAPVEQLGQSIHFHAGRRQHDFHHGRAHGGAVVGIQQTAVAARHQVWCCRCSRRGGVHRHGQGGAHWAGLVQTVGLHRTDVVVARGQRQITGISAIGHGGQHTGLARIQGAVVVGIREHAHLLHAWCGRAREGQGTGVLGDGIGVQSACVIGSCQLRCIRCIRRCGQHGHRQGGTHSAQVACRIGLHHTHVVHTHVQAHVRGKGGGRAGQQLVADQGFALVQNAIVVLVVEQRHIVACCASGRESQAGSQGGDVVVVR